MNNLLTKHILKESKKRKDFRKILLTWYGKYQRELPWRTKPSLYKTVVSEFMLQQTRVSTVLPYFANWLKKFPSFTALAKANEEDVLKGWEGLGYYSRARNLHKLAKTISPLKSIPKDAKFWLTLPGIGPYASAAITSISFNQAEAVCDGNVVRVLTRIFSHGELFKDGASAQKKLQPLAQQLLDTTEPGNYNQGMMELGATVCHRQSPLCTTCPVLSYCTSGQRGDTEMFPALARKKKTFEQIKRYWITRDNALLLQKAKTGANRLAGIYELPKDIESEVKNKKNLLAKKRRVIGQTDYEESIYQFSLHLNCDLDKHSLEWISWDELKKITISGPHRKWIEEIKIKLLK